MKTPIADFVREYSSSNAERFHMPGHKGKRFLGAEEYDITEIDGADSLYESLGIIGESEKNAAALFGTTMTVYGTEGSSQCIRAMLSMISSRAAAKGERALVVAGRNAHKSFYSAAVLFDFDFEFIPETGQESYLSCDAALDALEALVKKKRPAALYITSPDYLGKTADIEKISAICKKYETLLLVDNAHGAYLKFLTPGGHPIELGADMCCDSAHKTLPVLTGGAYLHMGERAWRLFSGVVREHMALVGSTSPSYLTLASLDMANAYIENGYRDSLFETVKNVERVKREVLRHGVGQCSAEPLKITLMPKSFGYTGREFADILIREKIMPEFSDADYTVLMVTPENGEAGLRRLERAVCKTERRAAIEDGPPTLSALPERVCSAREAFFAKSERVAVRDSVGRVLSSVSVSCPPAVPVAVSGERINEDAARLLEYYGTESVRVVLE